MSHPRHPSRRRVPSRLAAPARAIAALSVVVASTFGLSACRTIGPGSETAGGASDTPAQIVAKAPTSPAAAPTTPVATTAPVTTPLAPTTPRATTPRATTPRATTPKVPRESVAATSTTTPQSAVDESSAAQPPKTIVDDPWQIVGRPYLLNIGGVEANATGVTSYRLYFRTRGDFRGVRAGTAVDDPRHYKVGLIDVPELPAYVPGGSQYFALADRRKNGGRYCWSGMLVLKGDATKTTFLIRNPGVTLAVIFDLHGADAQNRTAPVVIQADRKVLLPEEKALGCHIQDFV